eukprot:GHVN01099747.1.p1 GENE.GHVN01099747.1~~GHVN01099747.1.p1  ORF type:complete len:220 (+),score=40.68 GHVN01099747.1:2504-3163(+)
MLNLYYTLAPYETETYAEKSEAEKEDFYMARWLIFSKTFSYTLKPTKPTWWQEAFDKNIVPNHWKRINKVREYLDKAIWTDEEQGMRLAGFHIQIKAFQTRSRPGKPCKSTEGNDKQQETTVGEDEQRHLTRSPHTDEQRHNECLFWRIMFDHLLRYDVSRDEDGEYKNNPRNTHDLIMDVCQHEELLSKERKQECESYLSWKCNHAMTDLNDERVYRR